MNRRDAREIAETITPQQIMDMFDRAKANIADWTVVSSVNKGATKGTTWNILTKGFDVNKKPHILAVTNMVREFGDYLTDNLKPKRKVRKKTNITLTHQNPVFET